TEAMADRRRRVVGKPLQPTAFATRLCAVLDALDEPVGADAPEEQAWLQHWRNRCKYVGGRRRHVFTVLITDWRDRAKGFAATTKQQFSCRQFAGIDVARRH